MKQIGVTRKHAMNIVMIASEAHPYAKSGGLADVTSSLPAALSEKGHKISVILPYYPQIMKDLCKKTSIVITNLGVPFGYNTEWAQLRKIEINKNLTYYFVEYNRFFDRCSLYDWNHIEYSDNAERFIFFSRAAMQAILALKIKPDIIHTHDWHTALCNVYLISHLYNHFPTLRETKSVLTIHNLGYQGCYNKGNLWWTGLGWDYFNFHCLEYHDKINLLKAGILTAHMVSTVSPTYAEEILSVEHGFQLDSSLRHCASRGKLRGILNGIDTTEWNPASDLLIPKNFTAQKISGKGICKKELAHTVGLEYNPNCPIIATVSRLVYQKGIDVLLSAIEPFLKEHKAQFVIVGSGEPDLQNWMNYYAAKYPGYFAAWIGYNNKLSHLVEAGADLFAMPSRYEPCGLNQMYSMAYGTLPIVRATGGLDDTVTNYDPAQIETSTGFKFYDLQQDALYQTLNWAINTFYDHPDHIRQMQINGMNTDFSWTATANNYETLYEDAFRISE